MGARSTTRAVVHRWRRALSSRTPHLVERVVSKKLRPCYGGPRGFESCFLRRRVHSHRCSAAQPASNDRNFEANPSTKGLESPFPPPASPYLPKPKRR